MTTIILVLQFVLAVILTIAILLQKSSSIGLGAYSGSNESLFGAKGPAGFLAKFTFIIGFLFIINTLALGYFYNKSKKASLAEDIKVEKPVKKAPVVPNIPVSTNTNAAPKAPATK
jgi:preprotein translocase subunit SecG